MLTYLQLRKLVENFKKYPGTKKIKPISVINKGFPGTFNLSLAEGYWLNDFGSYLDLTHDWKVSVTQPVIRPDDYLEHILPNKNAERYLALFGLTDIAGWVVLNNKDGGEKVQRYMINATYEFLTKKINLNPKRIYVSCFEGGKVNDVTKGKYDFDKYLEPDNIGIEEWGKRLPKGHMILDKTRDTFLSLLLFGEPSPWGYRNEIYYDIGKNEKDLLDIATIEALSMKPIFKNGKVVDVTNWESCFGAGGFGMERMLMAVNGFKHIRECDHIFPLYKKIQEDSINKDEHQAFILMESLRTAHRILIDCKGYAYLDKKRKDKFTPYLTSLYQSLNELKIPIKKIKDYLELNAKLQPFYPELKDTDFVAREIGYAFERKFNAEIAWPRAEVYEGLDGFKKMANEILTEKGIKIYAIASSKLFPFDPSFSEFFRKIRKERNIFLQLITDRTEEMKDLKIKDKEELRKIKFSDSLTKDLGVGIYIYKNKLITLTVTKKEMGGTVLENTELTEILRKLFEESWKVAEE